MDWESFFKKNLEPVMAYQPGLREEQIREIAQTDDIFKLSSNESPLPPFPAALEAMQRCLVTLNEYPDGSSHQLVKRLCEAYGLPPEQVIVGNGSNELIDDIAQTCLGPGDNVVYGAPSFVVYRSSAQIAGAQYREVPLDGHGCFDLEALLASIDEHTKIVFVCSPNNPSGGVVSDAAFARFMDAVPPHVLVVVDSAYQEFVEDMSALDATRYFDGVRPLVVLRTFSKMYALAGLRCGYGLAPRELVATLNKVREPFNVNTVAQVAAAASFGDADEIARRRQLNATGRQSLYACFEELRLPFYRSEANFVWVMVPDAQGTFSSLLERGVIVRPFAGAQGLRVGVGDERGVAATVAAFKELFG
ncbi:MAG: histidinol-phosphate transaminase [Coriobacteriales bacterium]|jgi:histidinol-phosphate aminotransferase|nr:histidinol-phosphate transaminase [Coriobacteriales bacterium]